MRQGVRFARLVHSLHGEGLREACHSAKLKDHRSDVYAKAVEVKLDEARLFENCTVVSRLRTSPVWVSTVVFSRNTRFISFAI